MVNKFEKDLQGLKQLLEVLGNQALVILTSVEEDDSIFTVEVSTQGGILPSAMIQGVARGVKGLKKLIEKGDPIVVVSVTDDNKLVTAIMPKRENRNANPSSQQPATNPNPQGQQNPGGAGQPQPNGQRQQRVNPGSQGGSPGPVTTPPSQPAPPTNPNPNPQGQQNPGGAGQQQTQQTQPPKKGFFEKLWNPGVFS